MKPCRYVGPGDLLHVDNPASGDPRCLECGLPVADHVRDDKTLLGETNRLRQLENSWLARSLNRERVAVERERSLRAALLCLRGFVSGRAFDSNVYRFDDERHYSVKSVHWCFLALALLLTQPASAQHPIRTDGLEHAPSVSDEPHRRSVDGDHHRRTVDDEPEEPADEEGEE